MVLSFVSDTCVQLFDDCLIHVLPSSAALIAYSSWLGALEFIPTSSNFEAERPNVTQELVPVFWATHSTVCVPLFLKKKSELIPCLA